MVKVRKIQNNYCKELSALKVTVYASGPSVLSIIGAASALLPNKSARFSPSFVIAVPSIGEKPKPVKQ